METNIKLKIKTAEEWEAYWEDQEMMTISELIKEAQKQAIEATLEEAAEKALLKFHDGRSKENILLKHFQSGSDNLTVSKQSILNLKSSDELKV